jgi:ATP-dependent exoDNAse (exonuclease V) alpha subunit
MTVFKWSNDQAEALKKLGAFMDSEDEIFLLYGSAGTGKTRLTQELPGLLKGLEMVATAPTHKACHVLRTVLPDTEVMTIHKFLGLKPKKSGGQSSLVRNRNYDPSEWANVQVVVLDEASMITSQVMEYVHQDIVSWGRQYVLVGDKYQLPPVGETTAPCFALDLPEGCKAELQEIVRQAADNPIIVIATLIRDAIIAGKEPPLKGAVTPEGVGVHLLSPEKSNQVLQRYVKADGFKHNPDSLRLLAYRNETVVKYNQVIREMLGEDMSVPFSVGDTVTAKEAWTVQDEVLIMTGDEFTVARIDPSEHQTYPQLKGYLVLLEEMLQTPVFVLDYLKSIAAYKSTLDSLRQSAIKSGDWRPYYALDEYYCDLRPCYSLTVHQSQGSTYDNVMLDYRDIYVNKKLSEADKCYSVAVTRARRNVYILI